MAIEGHFIARVVEGALKNNVMENKIVHEILALSRDEKKLIGIRKYNEGDDLYVGYVIDFNDIMFVLQHVTKYGLKDGLVVEEIASVEAFEMDDDYIRSYQFLTENVGKISEQSIETIQLNGDESWQYELMNSGFDKGKMVGVELNGDGMVSYGYVLDFDMFHLKFNPIDKIGNDLGISLHKMADISSLKIDDLESRKRQALYEWKILRNI